jgi:pimeloyl-ACP methyl ester carboxylesterase
MHNLKLKILLAAVMALQLGVTFADPVSERITATIRGNGPDVLLIPGLASSSAVWDATAKQLENYFSLAHHPGGGVRRFARPRERQRRGSSTDRGRH